MTKMGTLACAAVVGALWASVGLAQNRELGSSGSQIEGIAAIVDDGVVLLSELEMRLDIVVQRFRDQQAQLPIEQRTTLPPMSVLRDQVLEQLIVKQIQLQRADRIGIVVGDDVLNQALANVARNLNISLQELPQVLASEGFDYNLYRQDSREEITIGQLEQRDVFSRIRIAPRELEQCLTRLEATQTDEFDYNVSHILIGISGSATRDELEAARAKAEEVRRLAAEGTDFAQLALTYSDSGTALEGGLLGWRKGAELPTVFADIVPTMKAGQVSEAIQTGSGFHIVRLNEVRGTERVMVDQVRARHILVAPNELLDDDATRQKLLGIYEQIKNGDDFATLARSASEDALSAADGGDLGWTTPDVYVPEFAEKLRTQEIGELSEPFRTRFGWHIVEVTDRRSYDTTDDLKEQRCAEEIRASKVEEERALWLQQLRDQSYVDKRI